MSDRNVTVPASQPTSEGMSGRLPVLSVSQARRGESETVGRQIASLIRRKPSGSLIFYQHPRKGWIRIRI